MLPPMGFAQEGRSTLDQARKGRLAGLEHLDLAVDPQSRRLTGNPAHGGEHTYELY